eukprot:4318305-Pleurochrysis_carterae.AAC.1
MPSPLPPADVRNSLRSELMDRLMYCTPLQLEQNYDSPFRRSKRSARSSLLYKDLDRMLELGNLETRREIGDGNCGYYAYFASCAAAKV